jgi:chemotaxis protein methyltransferase WspC
MARYKEVELLLAEFFGLDIHAICERTLTRVVSERIDTAFSGDYPAFLRILKAENCNGEEFRKLVGALVVPETWFFRDSNTWEHLFAEVRSEWVGRPERGILKALSAPCSTGEEVYSIAITLARAGLPPSRFSIDGVDLSRDAIARARKGVYGDRCFRTPLVDTQAEFFSREEGNLRISPTLSSRVRLWEANLVQKHALADAGPYHLVFCRNLAIYLTPEARLRLIANVRDWLGPGGILFVGHSEVPLFQRAGFATVPFARSFALTASVPKAAAKPVSRRSQSAPRIQKEHSRLSRKQNALMPANPEAQLTAATGKTTESLLGKARQLADSGELCAARELCDSLMNSNSLDARVYYLAGLLEQASDRTDLARDLFGKAVYLDPAHYESLVQLSLLSEQRGETGTAARYRKRADKARKELGNTENAQ